MNEQDARRERHDYRLRQRHHEQTRWYEEPARLATSPYELGRGILKWGGIALGSWAVISGGMYIGWLVLRTSIFGPDLW